MPRPDCGFGNPKRYAKGSQKQSITALVTYTKFRWEADDERATAGYGYT